MKKYILLTIKKYLPFLLVGGILTYFIVSIAGLNVPSSDSNHYSNYLDSAYTTARTGTMYFLITAAIPMFILTCIGPLFANSYRNSLESADLYYQFGKDKRKIRFVHNLVILAMIVAILIVAYGNGLLFILMRQLPNLGRAPEPIPNSNGGYRVYFVSNYFFYIVALFALIIFGVMNYAVSYFFVTRANNAVNSVITLIFGQLILLFGFESPIWYSFIYDGGLSGLELIQMFFLQPTRSLSTVSLVGWLIYLLGDLISGTPDTFVPMFDVMITEKIVSLIFSIIALILTLGFTAFCIVCFFKEKESSGEQSGKAAGRDAVQYIIFHIGFGLAGLWYGTGCFIFYVFSLQIVPYFLLTLGMISFGAVYYVLLSLLRRNFRFNKRGAIILFASSGINLILAYVFLTTIIM